MSIASSMQISASGLTAERVRLDVISNNIANVNTTRGADGQPYRRQQVVFAARQEGGAFAAALSAARGRGRNGQITGAGVQVTAIEPDRTHDFKVVHDPGHPDADANGNVRLPNVEPIVEMVDMIAASRAYEAGVTAINSAKQMQQRALEIGRAS
jgi:flagellar basal-body rod protein FlgC